MRHKGFLLAAAGGVALAPSAQAADLPVKAPAYAPPPVASWEGFYLGLNAGAAWEQGHANGMNYNPESLTQVNGTGFIGGGQLGYNWQHGNFVYGFEADISGLTGDPSIGNKGALSQKIKWLSTIRGRMGLAVGDTMGYITAGFAFGGVDNYYNASCPSCAPNVKSESKTRAGWTVGGGIEHMWDTHWTIGAEALWVDLGKSTANSAVSGKTTTFSNQAVIARVKLNYKF